MGARDGRMPQRTGPQDRALLQKNSKMNTSELLFSTLFKRACACWPTSIDAELSVVNDARPDLYIVKGLHEVREATDQKFNDQPDAVLMLNLNDSIFWIVRSAALFCTKVEPASLRLSAVRKTFEEKLRRAATIPELGWLAEDIQWIDRYRLANAEAG